LVHRYPDALDNDHHAAKTTTMIVPSAVIVRP
jgi:hypothetical protein